MATASLDMGGVLRFFAPNGFGRTSDYRRLKDWLQAGSYIPVGNVTDSSFTLKPHDFGDLTGAITEEYCGSALSSFESMIEVERGARNRRALAWPAIEAYYSSFFAAHAFMRFFGVGCTWVTKDDFNRLRQVASVHNVLVGSGPRRGQWKYILTANGEVEFVLGGGSSGGGAHDVVWTAFSDVLNDVMAKVAGSNLIKETDKQAITLMLDGLKLDCGLTSEIRNGVNYRREFGVWFPYANFDSRFASLLGKAGGWRSGDCEKYVSSHAGSNLVLLFNFSYAMAALCVSLTRAGVKYFDGRSKRFSNGPMKLLATQPLKGPEVVKSV